VRRLPDITRSFHARSAVVAATLAVAAALLFYPSRVLAADAAVLYGTVTAAYGDVRLPGVEVSLSEPATGRVARTAFSEGTGQYRFDGLKPGTYDLVARLSGFLDLKIPKLTLASGEARELKLVLELAPVSETVSVKGEAGIARPDESESKASLSGRVLDAMPVESNSYRALLPMLPGVVRQPDGRISMKGSRPTQGALNVGAGSGVDPSTGNFGIELPSDAVETVDVVPNPYAAQDGRFSAGLVRVETRAGSGVWRATANSFIPMPCLTLCDGYSWGVRNYNPRVWFGGPLVKDKVFLSQALEYRLTHARIPSLPDPNNQQRSDSFDAFTRLDVHPAAGHALTATVAFFPRELRNATLNTFNPAEVNPDLKSWGYNVALSESATLSPRSVLASFVSASRYDATVEAHNDRDMELTVDGNRGGYFNHQQRRTQAFQWSEALTLSRASPVGDHLFKVGFDVLRSSYTGESTSRPVIIRRADGTISWREDFSGPTAQHADGTDLAAYAQDRWRVNPRLLFEPGVRVDHDGVVDQMVVSPRLGVVISVVPQEIGILRGGAGLFAERTPLNVAAFESFQAATITHFGPDGATPVGVPVTLVHRTLPLDTPRAVVWNVEYAHRLGSSVFVKVSHLERTGFHEFIVDPVITATRAELQLASRGQSEFRETEVSVRIGATDDKQVTISYVRSHSSADLNAYDLYFGTFRQPVIQPNESSITPVDVPNRLLVRASVPVVWKWSAGALLEVRNGFPYSLVNEDQAFVGARNTGGRLPTLCTLDVSLLRLGRILGREVRYGVKVFHVLGTFEPRDVQNNVDSPAFGSLYNGLRTRVMFTLQLTAK
jgi:hypothetical protein